MGSVLWTSLAIVSVNLYMYIYNFIQSSRDLSKKNVKVENPNILYMYIKVLYIIYM